MFCKHCGKQIDETSKFCPYCGGRIREIPIPEEIPQKPEIKTYSSIFWRYFGLSILLGIISAVLEVINVDFLWVLYLTAVAVYMYFFCKMINEAMSSIGKKNWWPLGLLNLIPLGFWIVFFVVRAQLKPHGKWSLKEGMSPWVIVLIVILIIAIIGILASIVLVSLGGARQKARDARIMSDLAQVRTIAELINSEYGSYTYLCDLNNTLNQNAPIYGLQLAEIENDILTQQGGTMSLACYSYSNYLGDKYCVEVKISTGFYCIDSTGNSPKANITPKCSYTSYNCSQ